MNQIKITIAGDLFLGRRVETLAKSNPELLFDAEILDIFAKSDFNIVNLESPLSDASEEYQISKTGPGLIASPETIGVLKLLKIDLVTLANNHIYDFGEKGLADTLELCKKNDISTVGAGINIQQATETYFKTIDGLTFGVVNITENEWSVADESHGGAHPMNIIANSRKLRKAKEEADVVIAIIHGGNEFSHYPSPRMLEQYRFYAEEGASIIIGHHTHCISGFEVYEGVPIFYGLGNFLFDSKTLYNGWFEGLVLNLTIFSDKTINWELVPIFQCKENQKVKSLGEEDKQRILSEVQKYNSVIADPIKLKLQFEEFSDSQQEMILSYFSTSHVFNSSFLKSVIRKLKFERYFLRRNQLQAVLNINRCESLRDVAFEVIGNYLGKKTK